MGPPRQRRNYANLEPTAHNGVYCDRFRTSRQRCARLLFALVLHAASAYI